MSVSRATTPPSPAVLHSRASSVTGCPGAAVKGPAHASPIAIRTLGCPIAKSRIAEAVSASPAARFSSADSISASGGFGGVGSGLTIWFRSAPRVR